MRKTVAYAFHHSIPILIGFFPVGLAYGLLMQQAGYNFLWSDRKSTRLNSSHKHRSRMPSSA